MSNATVAAAIGNISMETLLVLALLTTVAFVKWVFDKRAERLRAQERLAESRARVEEVSDE